jgi:hypothetical protein
MKKVETTSKVKVHYTGRLEDGTVFDTSIAEGREPLEVELGLGQLIKGFEAGLIDMSEGEKKTVEISVEEMKSTLGREPRYPSDFINGKKYVKCFLRPYYRLDD